MLPISARSLLLPAPAQFGFEEDWLRIFDFNRAKIVVACDWGFRRWKRAQDGSNDRRRDTIRSSESTVWLRVSAKTRWKGSGGRGRSRGATFIASFPYIFIGRIEAKSQQQSWIRYFEDLGNMSGPSTDSLPKKCSFSTANIPPCPAFMSKFRPVLRASERAI